jgi:hypothetical protein
MAYTNFTDQQVFADPSANIYCNLIWEYLLESFPEPDVNDYFCLTGTPAKIIQGATATAIKVIPLATSQDDMFDWCNTKLMHQLGATAIKYKDHLQFIVDGIYFEIWKLNFSTINTVSTIQVQDDEEIPNYIN